MKEVNLISILDAKNNLNSELFEKYKKYYIVKIKNEELDDLKALVLLLETHSINAKIFDKYFIGYEIQQIGKQFDLLRLDSETILNIELKRECTYEDITTQLVRNKYYLKCLNKEIYCFTFVSSENKLYKLYYDNTIQEVDILELVNIIEKQNVINIPKLNELFNPVNYLVSPFNSTEEFVNSQYFLTNHQEKIKKEIIIKIRQPNFSIISINGRAGTGKTLLTYDIAKEISKVYNILIIHCGILNKGHNILRDIYHWNIIPVKEIQKQDFSNYHLIVVDESQRIRVIQLESIISEVKKHNINCILSYDMQQTLRKAENENNIEKILENELQKISYKLTDKIRTNIEVSTFIKCLFDFKRIVSKITKFNNIDIKYFKSTVDSTIYLSQLGIDWKVINYTPSQYNKPLYHKNNINTIDETAHTVIGQEFDNVVAVVDDNYYYENTTGKLSHRDNLSNSYYDPVQMLFQIVTRTRIKLLIIIVNNQEILNRCLSILNND